MKSIIKSFSEHGTFVQPDTLEYILSKNDPDKLVSIITKKLKEYPLILTIDQVKNIEQENEIEDISKPCDDSTEKKELQKKILSTLYGDKLQHEIPFEDYKPEYDDITKDNQISNSEEESASPQLIEIKKVKGWKPESLEYESEIRILKDITGKSTCEGTTSDFTKLFLNRYDVLRKILRSQRREMTNVTPINKIRRTGVKEIQIVGIIQNIRTTKNGYKLIEIEDETGAVSAIPFP